MSSYAVSPSLSDDKSDERDVDMESDEDNCQSHSPGSEQYSQQVVPDDKRAHHNALERKRRDHIKDSFSGLRDSVPSLQGQKDGSRSQASRTQILKRAADYIQFMRRKNIAHQQDIDDLIKQNKDLETQMCSLQKAKVLQLGTLRAQAETSKQQQEESSKKKRASKKMKMSM